MMDEIKQIGQARCICCERLIEPACKTDSEEEYIEMSWEMPSDAVSMDGGANFGSTLYDSMMDGIGIEMVICDECIKKAKEKGFIRETKGPTFAERSLDEDHDTMVGILNNGKED